MKTMNKQLDRRSFIKVSALAGGGILIGFYTENGLLAQQRGAAPPVTPINPNTYIKVHPDNTFTIVAKNPETGQGIRNSLPRPRSVKEKAVRQRLHRTTSPCATLAPQQEP